MPIRRRSTSPPGLILAGIALVISLLLLGIIFTMPAEGELRENTPAFQTQSVYAATPGETGQSIFEQKCKSCHTIGGGRLVGPDLKGVTARRDRNWLIRFIVSPDQLIAQGDPIAKQLVQEYDGIPMPNMGLSEEEAKEVLAHIEAQSGGGPSPPPQEQDTGESTEVPTRDTDIGRDIFVGKITLKNGGAACFSCHNVSGIGTFGGGTVGKDLTEAYSTFGEQGLTSILESTPFPMMTEIYAEQPLTDDETAHLVAFLRETSLGEEPTPSQSPNVFIIISVVGFIIVIGILQLIWRKRLSGVRQPMVKGGSK